MHHKKNKKNIRSRFGGIRKRIGHPKKGRRNIIFLPEVAKIDVPVYEEDLDEAFNNYQKRIYLKLGFTMLSAESRRLLTGKPIELSQRDIIKFQKLNSQLKTYLKIPINDPATSPPKTGTVGQKKIAAISANTDKLTAVC